MSPNPTKLINRKVGNWWADDRKNWCAYCGVALEVGGNQPNMRTRDHVMPRTHKGTAVTIPACRCCNQAKANRSMPEFLSSKYFAEVRDRKLANSWSLRDLWLVTALAAVEQAKGCENDERQSVLKIPAPKPANRQQPR
ncbi:hypothetical protein JYU29_06725 [Tianweitania sp. BSSL-BM11]|uniref:HNH endonuclease n=1 Tax=Tianweitania aestuarii TaxID=2814886 RepID=A0ABS5RTK0_9HYPH|nr:hypothetical protein [Tianweitania aestuarii]MBS9720375.1 hypothetical protein [Tianweitania aestuarii]